MAGVSQNEGESAAGAAFAGNRRVPTPVNEPVKSYAPGSPERAELKARLKSMAAERIEIPLRIGGKEVRSGTTAPSVMPHDHRHVLENEVVLVPPQADDLVANLTGPLHAIIPDCP